MNWNRALTAGEVRLLVLGLVVCLVFMTAEALDFADAAASGARALAAYYAMDNLFLQLVQVCTQ